MTLALGARGVALSPLSFLRNPRSWLAAASRHGATHTAAPDFAFALAAARTPAEQAASLDLRALRVVMSAGEPVHPDNVDAFLRRFGVAGLAPEAFCPAYGLAEHTVGVTVMGKRSLHVDARALEVEGRFRRGAHCLIGCGPPAPGVAVAIVDPETRRRRPPDEIGEIWVDSPSKAHGYWNRPDESEATFHARLAGEDDARTWLRTGDEGFVHEGELFVTGRLKDLVIVRGRNVHPQDVEATVQRRFAQVRPGHVAAFGAARPRGEALCVLAELRDARLPDARDLAASIAARVAADHGVTPAVVALVPSGSVPRTTSGKVRRRECRERFERGELAVLHRWESDGVDLESPSPADARDTAARIARLVYERTRVRLAPDAPLAELGALDSMAVVELTVAIQEEFALPPDWIVDVTGGTLGEIAAAIDEMVANAAPAGDADPRVVLLREGDGGAPVFLVAPLLLGRAALAKLAASMRGERRVVGLVNDGSCADALELARAHVRAVLAHRPRGPWHLAGYSYGGAIVHLMARLLEREHGRAPEVVFLLDPQLPDAPEPRAGDPDLAAMTRLFLDAVAANAAEGRLDGEPDALRRYQQLADPRADAEAFARFLAGRRDELRSLTTPEVATLASRRLDGHLVYFRAASTPAASPDVWARTYRSAEVVDVPHDHFRLLDGAARIAEVIEARVAEAEDRAAR